MVTKRSRIPRPSSSLSYADTSDAETSLTETSDDDRKADAEANTKESWPPQQYISDRQLAWEQYYREKVVEKLALEHFQNSGLSKPPKLYSSFQELKKTEPRVAQLCYECGVRRYRIELRPEAEILAAEKRRELEDWEMNREVYFEHKARTLAGIQGDYWKTSYLTMCWWRELFFRLGLRKSRA